MHLHWLQHLQHEIHARCPLCREEGPKGAVLSTDHVLAGQPPVTFLRCPACGAAFLQDLTPPDYDVEQGAGIDLIVAPLQRLPSRAGRRCLEIGGSFGFALDFCRSAFGWEVLEVDPSPLAAAGAEALGLPLRRAYFSAGLDLGPEPFDVAILSEVIEHVADPHPLLAAIRDRLSPDGILVLSTPNLALVRPEAEAGMLRRALSPGLHMILYDRAALARVLREAGFAAVQIDESPETLRAFAARSSGALAGLRPADPAAERARLRGYLAARAASAPPASALACGFAYRHFKECVNAGLYDEAAASRVRLAQVYAERFGLDLDKPSLETGRTVPYNLVGALFFSGILELNGHGRPEQAASRFASAVAAAVLVERQTPLGFADGETEALLAQSRKHLPMALAAIDPDRAAREVEALERAAGTDAGVPPALLDEARAQTFIRLVNAGAYAAAERLASGIVRQTQPFLREGQEGEVSAEVLDCLHGLGVLVLHRKPVDLPWPARLHDRLSRARASLAARWN
jgi:SAM-dependent methyltransferase